MWSSRRSPWRFATGPSGWNRLVSTPHGTTGLLLPPGRPRVLVKRLRDLLATPMKLTGFGIAAADRARSRYPWERIAAETAAAYERCLATPGALRPAGAEPLSSARQPNLAEQRRAA